MASSETSNLSRIKLALQKSIDANKKANLEIKSDEDYFLEEFKNGDKSCNVLSSWLALSSKRQFI